ncbi:hypothetical protein DMUE_4082 [Dictyocoela muelleri]|nr:hypothetical protein DMUE_4082 [Dictyocoela muelleri]
MESVKNKILINCKKLSLNYIIKNVLSEILRLLGIRRINISAICRLKYCRAIRYLFGNTPFKGNMDHNIKCLIVYYMFLKGSSVNDFFLWTEWDHHTVYRILKKMKSFDIYKNITVIFNR